MTTADDKQNQLQKEILEVQNRLLQLPAAGSSIPTPTSTARSASPPAKKVARLADLRRGAGLPPRPRLAGIALRGRGRRDAARRLRRDRRAAATATRCPGSFDDFLHEWATVGRAQAMGGATATSHEDGGPWLDPDDLNAFTRYLRDYLLTDDGVRRADRAARAGGEPEDARRGGPPPRPAQVRAHHPQRLHHEPRPEHGADRRRRARHGRRPARRRGRFRRASA